MVKSGKNIIEIDAKGQTLGRFASNIAFLLQGKALPQHTPEKDDEVIVRVKNANHLKITGDKLNGKIYRWYTGYPGGLKERKLKELFPKNAPWVLWHAVFGMLPKNKLRENRIKRLVISH